MKLVSIIIPSYQHAKALRVCLGSVTQQSYDEVEVIVVDDGSTDETKEVVKMFDGVRYVYQENAGPQVARNRGFDESRGEFVIFCDADVVMQPGMIEKMVKALDGGDVAYVYSGFRFGWKVFGAVEFDEKKLKTHNFIHTTSLIRREVFPGFDVKVKRLQDWDLWLTLLENGHRGVCIDEVLFAVQVDGESRVGSSWLPRFMYGAVWRKVFGWVPALRTYEAAREVIFEKHGL